MMDMIDDNFDIKYLEISHGKHNDRYCTILDNFVEFCESIRFSNPTLLARVIGTALSCRVDMSCDKYAIIGYWGIDQVTNIVHKFIQNHLLCKNCGTTDVNLRWSRTKKCCKMKCNVCGFKQLFNSTYDSILCNL